jgi:hypothetical protein
MQLLLFDQHGYYYLTKQQVLGFAWSIFFNWGTMSGDMLLNVYTGNLLIFCLKNTDVYLKHVWKGRTCREKLLANTVQYSICYILIFSIRLCMYCTMWKSATTLNVGAWTKYWMHQLDTDFKRVLSLFETVRIGYWMVQIQIQMVN